MSKYYSYMFYADRNVRPCTILGYTLTTFPKSLMHNQSNRNLWHSCKEIVNYTTKQTNKLHDLRAVEPCIIGGESRQQVFYTARKQLNKNKEGGNSQPSKQQEKGQH